MLAFLRETYALVREKSSARHRRGAPLALLTLVVVCAAAGCAVSGGRLRVEDLNRSFPPETIISAALAGPVDWETMMADLDQAAVIYIGERHNDAAHHDWQLRIVAELHRRHPGIALGMEMFDTTYQPVLDRWSAGGLDRSEFLERVHWYANWRFPFALYEPLLLFAQQQHIPLYGLNLPSYIPRKIAVGGIDSLSEEEKRHLAGEIDTTVAAHRNYVQRIYALHRMHAEGRFDYFYLAQCAWEDTMAENIAAHLGRRKMVVLVGNGHIIRKFGIPDRVFRRKPAAFRSVYLAPAEGDAETGFADYLIVTRPTTPPDHDVSP